MLRGSVSEPVSLHLTSGTTSPPGPNTPITGKPGTIQISATGKSAGWPAARSSTTRSRRPARTAARGPRGHDRQPGSGLPAAAGTNTAILNGAFYASRAPVAKHELALPEIGRCVKVVERKSRKNRRLSRPLQRRRLHVRSAAETRQVRMEPGAGAGNKFTGESKATSLETKAKTKIACLESQRPANTPGRKPRRCRATFTGCALAPSKEQCQTSGSAPAKSNTTRCRGELGFIKDEPILEGLDVSSAGCSRTAARC